MELAHPYAGSATPEAGRHQLKVLAVEQVPHFTNVPALVEFIPKNSWSLQRRP